MSTVFVVALVAAAGVVAVTVTRSLVRDVRRLLDSPPEHDDYSHIKGEHE